MNAVNVQQLAAAARPQHRLALRGARPARVGVSCRRSAASHVVCAFSGLTSKARPSSAELARTAVDISTDGTLYIVGSDGWPMGAHASYVLDASGQPVIQAPANAAYRSGLEKDNVKCSLFVQPSPVSGTVLYRASLQGTCKPASPEVEKMAAEKFSKRKEPILPGAKLFHFNVEKVHLFAGLAGDAAPEHVTGDEYRGAEPDLLRRYAPAIVRQINEERIDDVARFVVDAGVEDAQAVEMFWVDKAGFDVRVTFASGITRAVRIGFSREAISERDAVSLLTLLAQQLWEKERQYKPQRPAPVTVPPVNLEAVVAAKAEAS